MKKLLTSVVAMLFGCVLYAADGNFIRVYCQCNQTWWIMDGAAIAMYAYADGDVMNAAWPGERMMPVDGTEGLWTAEVDASVYTNLIFVRVSDSGEVADWGAKTGDLTVPTDGQNMYVITSSEAQWGDPGVEGYWDVYQGDAGGTDPVTDPVQELTCDFETLEYLPSGDEQYTNRFKVCAGSDITAVNIQQPGFANEVGIYLMAPMAIVSCSLSEDKYVIQGAGIVLYCSAFADELTTLNISTPDEEYTVQVYQRTEETTPTMQQVVALAGDFNEWDTSANILVPDADNLTASVTVPLTVANYQFKMVVDGSWLSLNGDGDELYSFHREWYSASHVNVESGTNFKLKADVTGDYVFTWTYADSTITITFPEADPTAGTDEHSYYLTGDHEMLGSWNAFDALPMDGGSITVELPAGKYAIKVFTEDKSWDTALDYDNLNTSCFSIGITKDADRNIVFTLVERSNLTVQVVGGLLCVTGEFWVPEAGQYTNYAALINQERTVNCYYSGKAASGYPQYNAKVQLNAGDTLRIIDRANSNYAMQAELDEYGLTGNFESGNFNSYHICRVAGCYDVYYSYNNLYIGSGEQCSEGDPYDGEILPTGWVRITVTNEYNNGQGSVEVDGVGASSSTGVSEIYVIGSILTLEAHPSSSFQFLQWSDGVLDNPRTFVVEGDTVVHADMGRLDSYPYGVLVNSEMFIRSTYTDGSQYMSRAQLEVGDTIQLIKTGYNTGYEREIWMSELEPYGSYENFSGGAEQGYLVCRVAGCYNVYIKVGDTRTVYIGEGTNCSRGEKLSETYVPVLAGYYFKSPNESMGGGQDIYMEDNSLSFHLQPGRYEFSVSDIRTQWIEGVPLSSSCSSSGTYTLNGNYAFTLTEESDVNFYVSDGSLCAQGNFGWTYSAVGDSALFGTAWNTEDTRTEFTYRSDDLWTYTIDSVQLHAGSYEYKVISNHSWDVTSYPSDGNYTLVIETDGVYSIAFTLNPGNGCSHTTNLLHAIGGSETSGRIWNISPSSPNESDNLRLVLLEAEDGDTIVMAGGVYEESNMNYIEFKKSVVVMAAEGAEPILRPYVPLRIKEGAQVQLYGLKIDATYLNESSYEHLLAATDANDNSLLMDGCEIYNFLRNNSAINCSSDNQLSSLVINNCYFHDMTKSIMFLQNPGMEKLHITNSTFANVSTETDSYYAGVIDCRGDNTNVLVDHCTFYDCQVMNSDYGAVTVRNSLAMDVTVSNCIFAMPESYSEGRAVYTQGGTVSNCISYNYTRDSGLGIRTAPTITNCVAADPLFVNAAGGEFTLSMGSPAIDAASDGSNLGDPRWGTNEQIPSTDFSESYVFMGLTATLSGNIELNQLNHIAWPGRSENGVAKWKINVTRACAVKASIQMESGVTSGHQFAVAVMDANQETVAELTQLSARYDDTTIELPDSIMFFASGDYTIVLSNLTQWSEAAVVNMTFTPITTVIDDGGNTGEDVLYSTTFSEWESQSLSTEQTLYYGDITFFAKNIKVVPGQKPTSVSDASIGYIQPTNSSSGYLQTGMLPFVSRVTYVQAAGTAGRGWQLESSSDGENWYAFNENDPGCDAANIAETREMYVFMENVWLRWTPTSATSGTNIYLNEITIYGNAGSSSGDPQIVASGDCAADGSPSVTWLLTSDSILTIGGNGAMADYNEETVVAPWYQYRDAYNSVYIASGVTNVGNLAFSQSPNLRFVDLASTVTSLGSYCFYDCPALHVLNLPESVTTVGDNSPFGGSTTITATIYNSHVFVRLPQEYAGEYTVAEGTTVIASDAFKGCNMLTSVVLPNSVSTLAGSSTFENCSALGAVNIPDGITTLGLYTFSGCSSLQSIDLPASITSLGSYCFGECAYVESITCRATTPPEANGSTFAGVNYMIPIYVPQSSLEQYPATDGWSGFTDYRAIEEGPQPCVLASGECGAQGDNLTWVLDCDSVLTISGEGEMPSSYSSNATPWYQYGPAIKHINIEEGVTKLALNAFSNAGTYANYPNVRTLTIPSTMGAPIETSFFYGCQFTSVTINSDTIAGKASYSSNSSLQTKFGAQVEEYIFGDNVRSIANFAFYNQSPDSLRSIILPEGLEAIGNWAFGYIEHLTSVTIPSTVQTIGTDAFAGCSNLRSIELGEGLMTVNGQAFWMCDNLTHVTCYAMNPPTLNSTAFDHNNNDTLFVLCEAKAFYQEADYWKNFGKIMCPDDTIGGYTEPDAPEQITFALDSSWKFIMLPTIFGLMQDDIIVDGGEIEWGIYNSEQRASGMSGWRGFVPSSGFSTSRSYIVRARNGSATLTINVPEQAREKAGAAIPFAYYESTHAENANWNFLGNPYPFSYNITAALEAQGIESPITVWNGRGYEMFTPGIDEKILTPFEAFFIQMPEGGTEVLQYTPEYIDDSSSTNTGNNSVADANGALPGYFTINTSKQKVQFSRGNLQYQASTNTWQFAENQYEIVGDGNANISSAYDGWIDLFGWGTGNNPTKTSTSNCDYSSFVDWGINAISNGGNTENMWHTLSANEWTYITGQRTNCDSLCGRATVNGIQGFILLPDDWVSPGIPFQGSKNQGYELNQYSLEEWQKMEAAGAVFLPACGGRAGTEYSSGGWQYWSTNAGTSCYAYDIITGGASDYKLKTNEIGRHGGYGVRLVK